LCTLTLKPNIIMKNILVVMGLLLSINQIYGQRIIHSGAKEPLAIELNEVYKMVNNLADSIEVNYIIGEKAQMLKENLLKELKKGKFDHLTERDALAAHLSNLLVTWSKDEHFFVMKVEPAGQRQMMPSSYDHFSSQNYFFEKMEHLSGNIAYIKLDRFIPPVNSGGLVVAAMLFAANSEAVIIDLRGNMGGSPQMVSMLAGFFMKEPTLININKNRATGIKQETWSAETDVIVNSTNQEILTTDLEKLRDLPVYILTSDYTFSAAEMFSSALQGHKRATVVGETTGGGGHGIRPFEISGGFTAFIPFNRHYHPITKEGWEVVGIQPDIACDAIDALKIAQITALDSLLKNTQNPQMKYYYEWHLKTQKGLSNPMKIESSVLKSYTGQYNERVITFENEKLYYQRGTGKKYELTIINENEFMLDGLPDFRIRFILEKKTVIALEGLYIEGETDRDFKN
jgi:hypothetical protein